MRYYIHRFISFYLNFRTKRKKHMIIGLDFDGTVVTHEYPHIGSPVPDCIETLKLLQDANHKIILWTMRSGRELDHAINYLNKAGISLFGVNMNPTQNTWTKSPKAYCQLYIDDAALGCPLIYGVHSRPFVNWKSVQNYLKELKVL